MNSVQTVRIIGGGLAGLSLGIALRRVDVPTEIFEAGDYPRHRVCGEFITGLDETTIEKLGINEAFAAINSHSHVTWFRGNDAFGSHTLPTPARALSRFALDARLAKIFVSVGGKLFTHSRIPPPLENSGWVTAAGRDPRAPTQWVGLKLHIGKFPSTEGLELHLGEGAYVGLSAVEDGWINVCGLFRRRPGLRWEHDQALPVFLRASGLHALADRLGRAQIRTGSVKGAAVMKTTRRIRNDEGVNLGDACAMIAPFTGNGMAMAFISAGLALDPLLAWAKRERSWDEIAEEIRQSFRRQFSLRLNIATLLHPFILKPGLQSCVATAARAGVLPFGYLYRLLH